MGFLIVIIVCVLLSRVDWELVFFVFAVLCSAFITRRIFLDLNLGSFTGHKIQDEGKELTIQKGVDMSDFQQSALPGNYEIGYHYGMEPVKL